MVEYEIARKYNVNHGDKMYKNDAQKMYNQPPIKFL